MTLDTDNSIQHLRSMLGSVVDWYALYREAYRTLRPGGWIEHCENSCMFHCDDNSILPNSPMDEWCKVYWEGGKKFGRSFRVIEDNLQEKGMRAAGFVDLTFWDFKVRPSALDHFWWGGVSNCSYYLSGGSGSRWHLAPGPENEIAWGYWKIDAGLISRR